MCTLCVQRAVCAISPSHRFNWGSLSLFLSLAHLSSIAFNWAQFVDFYCTCARSAAATVRAKNIWPVKVVYLYFEQSSKKRALWPSSIRSSTNLSISGGRFLKLVIMRKSNTLAHTHTHSHTTRTHSQKVDRVCKQLTRFFFLFNFFLYLS